MKKFFLFFLLSCGDSSNHFSNDESTYYQSSCIQPSGNYFTTFSEIEGDCGDIPNQTLEFIDIECEGYSEFNELSCNYSGYDNCPGTYQEVDITVLDSNSYVGHLYLETAFCQSVYFITGER